MYISYTRGHLLAGEEWLCYLDAGSPSALVELQRSSGRPCKCQNVGTAEDPSPPEVLKLLSPLCRSVTHRHPRELTRAARDQKGRIGQRKTQKKTCKSQLLGHCEVLINGELGELSYHSKVTVPWGEMRPLLTLNWSCCLTFLTKY